MAIQSNFYASVIPCKKMDCQNSRCSTKIIALVLTAGSDRMMFSNIQHLGQGEHHATTRARHFSLYQYRLPTVWAPRTGQSRHSQSLWQRSHSSVALPQLS